MTMDTEFEAGMLLSESMPDEPVLCIVHFENVCLRDGVGVNAPMNPGIHFQVTLDKKKVLPDGGFIRFDQTKGDELHGWMRMDWLRCAEVLG